MKNYILILMVCMSLATYALAEESDSVILVTTQNYPDSCIGAAAAQRIGAPVLLTEKDDIPTETKQYLEELNPGTIYLIGGPLVIGDPIEDQLESEGYTVVRLWGITRYGTSNEVAGFFWAEGSDTAVLVSDNTGFPDEGNAEMIAYARDLAQSENCPLLISGPNMSLRTYETLKGLSVSKLNMIGDFPEEFKGELNELQIRTQLELRGSNSEIGNHVRERIKNQTKTEEKNRTILMIASSGGWQSVTETAFTPGKSFTRIIESTDDLESIIPEIQNADVRVAGRPEFVDRSCSFFDENGINSECISGQTGSSIASKIAERDRDRIRNKSQKFEKLKEQNHEQLREKLMLQSEECDLFFDEGNASLSDMAGFQNRIAELNQLRLNCKNQMDSTDPLKAQTALQQMKNAVYGIQWSLGAKKNAETQKRSESAQEIRNQVRAVKELGGDNANSECMLRIQEMESLENQGEYTQVQLRIKTATQACAKTQGKTTSTQPQGNKRQGQPSTTTPGKGKTA